MKRKVLFGSLATAALLGMPHLARADFFFSVRGGAGNTYNVYKMVTTPLDWDHARAASATTNFNGTPGHLVTMSSGLENLNVWTNAGNGDVWIGLTDSSSISTLDGFTAAPFGAHEAGTNRAAGSGWAWVTGEPYSDIGVWGGGEPNDWNGGVPGEDAAHFRGSDGLWNDHLVGDTIEPAQGGSPVIPYVIEYDTQLQSNPWSEWRLRTYKSNFATNAGPQITNYQTADALINGVGIAAGFPVFESTIATDTTDLFTNGAAGTGHFTFDLQVPGLSPSVDNDDFAVVGTGQFQAVNPGTYTFRTTTDDGSRLRLSVNGGAAQQVITDDVLSAPHDATGTIVLAAGDTVDFDWMWFERGGGATGELSYSADGTNYFLVGDDTGGLTPTTEVTIATYKSNPGNAVTGPALNTLADANSIRDNAHLRGEARTNTFNISNDGSVGFYGFGGQAPGLTNDQDDFTVVGDGFLEVRVEGDYNFASLSDDGARLLIDGTAVITDDLLHGAGYPGDVKFGTVHLTPGFHPIEYMFFERGGGASGELWLADANNQPIALVGDVLNGGLRVVQEVPEPSTLVLGGLGLFGLVLGWIRKKFKK